MTDASTLFELAQLAEASYANLTLGKDVKTELQNPDFNMSFSDTQAAALVADWSVITHQPDAASGYSSTLFKSTDTDGGGYVLAFRGTAGATDLEADVGDIVGDGLALKQIVDMYNEWQRINAASGASYSAAQLNYLTAESAAYVDAQLKLGADDPEVRAMAQAAIDAFKARTDVVFDGLAAYTIEYVNSATLFGQRGQSHLTGQRGQSHLTV